MLEIYQFCNLFFYLKKICTLDFFPHMKVIAKRHQMTKFKNPFTSWFVPEVLFNFCMLNFPDLSENCFFILKGGNIEHSDIFK